MLIDDEINKTSVDISPRPQLRVLAEINNDYSNACHGHYMSYKDHGLNREFLS